MDIETIRNKHLLNYYNTLLEVLNKGNDNNEYIAQITENIKNLSQDVKSVKKLNTMYNEIMTTSYKRKWCRLNKIQKQNKIIEYVNEHFDTDKKDEMKEKCLELLNKKGCKSFEYDETNGKLINIKI